MELKTKLKTLSRLAESTSDAAISALREEVDLACATLLESVSYDDLDAALDILKVIAFRESQKAVEAVTKFIGAVPKKQLQHPAELLKISPEISKYRNAETLTLKAIEVVRYLRYLEIQAVLRVLFDLSNSESERVQKKALEAVEALAGYDIGVFYGRGDQRGIGAAPQLEVIKHIEAFDDDQLRHFERASLRALNSMLSPEMGGTTWSYQTVTISRAATPADGSVSTVRERCISMLLRMFKLAKSNADQLKIIMALHGATRTGRGVKGSEDGFDMFVRDATRILDFFASVVPTLDMPVVQKIEHDSYWIHYHGISEEVKKAALRVKEAIDAIGEYAIYKNLVGFEGIFGSWEPDHSDQKYSETDKLRRENAAKYVAQIDEVTFPEWRDRIIRYAAVDSNDLATFPIFYFFLEELGRSRPGFGLKLLKEHHAELSRVLIPILGGVWTSAENGALRELIAGWVKEGNYLRHVQRMFLNNTNFDIDLSETVMRRAIEVNNQGAVHDSIAVAISNYRLETVEVVPRLVLPSLVFLTDKRNAMWVFDSWFRKELRGVLEQANEELVDGLLANLAYVPRIDYHVEEMLFFVAQKYPGKVVDYFVARASKKVRVEDEMSGEFENLPFQLSKVGEALRTHPKLVIEKFREAYSGNYSKSINDGGRFITRVFPTITEDLEVELKKLVQKGTQREIQFVLSILRNYEGNKSIHAVCKALVEALPKGSKYLSEVAIALESTGMVSGELGFALAYEKRRDEIQYWLEDPDPKVREFAESYIASLTSMAAQERKRAQESITLEKHRYGVDDGS